MATQANTQIDYNFGLLSICGFPIEHYRIAAGATPGDTSVITPSRFTLVKGVYGPVTHNVTSTTGATNVTVTLGVFGATNATIGTVDVWIVGFERGR